MSNLTDDPDKLTKQLFFVILISFVIYATMVSIFVL